MTSTACRRWVLAAALLIRVASLPALASLGAGADSIASDGLKIKGTVRVSSKDAYTVHEIQTPSGTLVREYLTPDGKVFAVAWRGPTVPDLAQILGDYFKQYSGAPRTHPADHKHFAIVQPDFVLQSSGRMRAFQGRAYIPGLVPHDVAVTEIQ
jgi:Protein of unknown function (DUF2844)